MEEDKCHKCSNIIRFLPDGKIQERKRLKLCEVCYRIHEIQLEHSSNKHNKFH